MKRLYFDYAATTPMSENVYNSMKPYFVEIFGNPNSQHSFGRDAIRGVDNARSQVARAINCLDSEIYFTSSGTEANNWAVKGIAHSYSKSGKHIISSAIEHPSVKNSVECLKNNGFEVTLISVNSDGIVDIKELEKAIRKDTILISIMMANNEMGAIQPSEEIGKIAKQHKVYFHVDAVQAFGSIPVDVKKLNCDLLTISAHKFYGPKGVGALFIRTGVKLERLIAGGEQERGQRGGTTATPLVVGMGQAAEDAIKNIEMYSKHCKELKTHFINRALKEIPYIGINGDPKNCLPNNVNISFKYIEGESILMRLDLDGIAVSSGSACSSGTLEPSYVLNAMSVPIEVSHSSIRFTFGMENTKSDVDLLVEKLKKVVESLREISPLYSNYKGVRKND